MTMGRASNKTCFFIRHAKLQHLSFALALLSNPTTLIFAYLEHCKHSPIPLQPSATTSKGVN